MSEVSPKTDEISTGQEQESQSPRVVIEFQGVPKKTIGEVWELLKAGGTPEGSAHILARSMADHQHWFPFYETIGIFDSGEEYPGDVDPFLHVNLHMLIGMQVLTGSPKEAKRFYQTRVRKKDTPHEIIHMMMNVFQRHLVWTAVNMGPEGKLDLEAYADTLKVLRPLKKKALWEDLGGL